MKQTRKKKVGKSPNTTTSQRKNEPAFTAVFTEDNPTSFFQTVVFNWKTVENNNNNNNNNTYIALIRMRSKRFTSIALQYDLEI